jgi:hypothetical protein
MTVQGEIICPNTAAKLTKAITMTKSCNHTLGIKNHVRAMAAAIAIVIPRGSQKTSIMNMPQLNKNANRSLATALNAEIGIKKRTTPSTVVTAMK